MRRHNFGDSAGTYKVGPTSYKWSYNSYKWFLTPVTHVSGHF